LYSRARANKRLRSFICHTYVHPKRNRPALTPWPQNVTSLWLILIFRAIDGTRLSWPGWLGEILRWFTIPKTGHLSQRPWEIELVTIDSQVRRSRQSHYSTVNIAVQYLLLNFVAYLEIDKLEKNSIELMQGPQYYWRLYLVQFIQCHLYGKRNRR